MEANKREFRNLIQPLAIRSAVEGRRFESDYYVEGYATTFDEPYLLYDFGDEQYYERIDRHALDDADMSDVIMQYNHQGRVLARLSNNTLGLDPDDHGLLAYADLSKSSASRDLYEDINNKLITKMSWAFTVREASFDRETMTRTIYKIKKVYDVSAVSVPANDDTEISARSFVDGVISKRRAERLRRQRDILYIKLMMEENS